MRKLMIGLFAAVAAVVCGAADKYWTGAAGDGLLETAHNWLDEVAPASGDSLHFDTPSATPVRVVFPQCSGVYYVIPKITGTKDYTLVMNKAFAMRPGDLSEFAGNIEVGRTADASYPTGFNRTSEKAATIHGLSQQGYLTIDGSYSISIDELSGDGYTDIKEWYKGVSFGSILGSMTAFSIVSAGTVTIGVEGSDVPSHARFIRLKDETPTLDIKGGGFSVDVLRTAATTTKLTKSGDATLTVKDLRLGDENMTLQVNGGKVVLSRPVQPSADPQIAEGAFLHLDASLKDTFTFSDADNQVVSEWRDCREDATGKATAYIRNPKRVESVLNGLAVVDFGAHKAADAGILTFANDDAECCREGFLVMREKASKSKAFFLGGTSTIDFHAGNDGALLNKNNNHPRVLGGAWAFDGETVIPWEAADGLSAGNFHVVRFSLAEPARANFLCADRGGNFGFGGWEMAEVVIYSTALTEQQRVDTEAFLLNKWLEKEHPNVTKKNVVRNYSFGSGVDSVLATDDDVELSSLVGDGRLVKEGVGTVTASLPSGYAELDVREGALEVSALQTVEEQAVFHLDASDEESLTMIRHPVHTEDESMYVKEWRDVRNNGYKANLDSSKEKQPASYPDIYPKVIEGGLNNKRYIDFGDVGDNKTPGIDNRGKKPFLVFNKTITDAREIFLVWKDNEADKYSCILSSANWITIRGSKGAIAHTSYCYNDNYDSAWLDDVGLCYPTKTPPSAGWHVMSIVLDPETKKRDVTPSIDGLACDRQAAFGSGGVSLAEVIIFDKRLDDEERAVLRAKLQQKWTAPETVVPTLGVKLDSVSIGSGAALKSASGLTTSTFGTGGTLDTERLTFVDEAAEVDVTLTPSGASGTTVNGAVTLPATGTVQLQLAEGVTKVKGGLYPILTSATGEFSFDGDIKDWTLTGDYQSVIKNRVRLVVKEDGLYLELPKPGLVLIVR